MINCLKIKSLKSLYKPNQLNFSTISSPIIFDHNAKRIQKDRAARAQDSQVYDYLKQEFASRLADRVLDIKRYEILIKVILKLLTFFLLGNFQLHLTSGVRRDF